MQFEEDEYKDPEEADLTVSDDSDDDLFDDIADINEDDAPIGVVVEDDEEIATDEVL